jgi:hypothetical protein
MGSMRRRIERLEARYLPGEAQTRNWLADERRAEEIAKIEALWEGLSEEQRQLRLPHLLEIEERYERRRRGL